MNGTLLVSETLVDKDKFFENLKGWMRPPES